MYTWHGKWLVDPALATTSLLVRIIVRAQRAARARGEMGRGVGVARCSDDAVRHWNDISVVRLMVSIASGLQLDIYI